MTIDFIELYIFGFIILAKRVSKRQKELIIESFINGKTLEQISEQFQFTKLTISRNLKREMGEKVYKELLQKQIIEKEKYIKDIGINDETNSQTEEDFLFSKLNTEGFKSDETKYEQNQSFSFMEIAPLYQDMDVASQKDLSSIPISEIKFPDVVYMVVDKKIELQIKYLKDYPDWQFLALEELNRKTIEIHYDIKVAKRFCSKDQKVIKVPNTNVFKIVAPLLISRGITRIVSFDQLIAL